MALFSLKVRKNVSIVQTLVSTAVLTEWIYHFSRITRSICGLGLYFIDYFFFSAGFFLPTFVRIGQPVVLFYLKQSHKLCGPWVLSRLSRLVIFALKIFSPVNHFLCPDYLWKMRRECTWTDKGPSTMLVPLFSTFFQQIAWSAPIAVRVSGQ